MTLPQKSRTPFGTQCASGGCLVGAEGACGQCVALRGLGQSCDGPRQGCSSSASCQGGVCVSTRKTLGESCGLEPKGGDRGDCDDELFCTGGPSEPTGHCAPTHPRGAACTPDDPQTPCVSGTLCDDGVCVPFQSLQEGEPCGGNRYCQQNLVCDPTTHLCRAGVIPQGASCGIVNGSFLPDECEKGTACGHLPWPQGNDQTPGTCLPLPQEGEACIGYDCADGLFCWERQVDNPPGVISTCERPRQQGEACIMRGYRDIDCAPGLECRSEVCQPACQ